MATVNSWPELKGSVLLVSERSCKTRPMKISFSLVIAATVALSLTSCKSTESHNEVDRFATADSNGDGKLTPNEASDYFISTVFAGRDANHDGKLTWDEWNVPGSGRTRKQFDAADTDKDGSLSRDEATVYGRKAHLYQKEFHQADTNHDGYVTRDEAKAYYASKEGPAR